MSYPQTSSCREFVPNKFNTHTLCKVTSFDAILNWEKYTVKLERLVAAAWSIVGSRWFYKDEIHFHLRVARDNTHASLPVRVLTGPDMTVGGLLRQLEAQIVPENQGILSKHNAAEHAQPQGFSIVYGSEPNDGKSDCTLMLECGRRESGLHFEVYTSGDVLRLEEAQRLARSTQKLLEQFTCGQLEHTVLSDIDMISERDLADVWRRNGTVPQAIETPAHETIRRHASERPEACAVCAWDGSWTYKELDDLSTRLALGLIRAGVGRGVTVPLYFEKSKWMPVAILGVMKAGGVFLQLASSVPKGRTEAILSVDKPPFALTGPDAPSWLADLVRTYTVHDLLSQDTEGLSPIPKCSLSQDCVQLFTSGSTGQPKGIVWTHEVLATNCQEIANIQSMGPHTRQFQTASYEFDVSMMETIAVLLAGGCLCIPPEQDGVNCSPATLEALRANSVYLTPTLAEALDPDAVPSLKTLALEGEILPKHVVSKWAGRVTMFNFYGPAECPHVAACVIDPDAFQTGFAGSTSVCLRWVVDPHNHEKLLPDGAIGELLVEGPILLDRYVGNVPNAAPFVSPRWLHCGCPGVPGREGRLFKTGDLVRCDDNGDLTVIGRKDTQVQIHGERVELSEVEHNVRRFLKDHVGVVAEMIIPSGYTKPILAAFLVIGDDMALSPRGPGGILKDLISGVERLADYVPQTFIPAVYIPVRQIPMTVSGKTNRRELRQMGSSMTLEELAAGHLACRGETGE
ncbi:putative polyketide synthase [Aspergillus campestris IBT 28561]|uniref:Polyketide synthase n=1 Tax=Aspergillus campestris (strain IBT 28561) TaxID=1392248 RepID=A0A2I1D059_ASPC2|nr:putative polyketide synthase [Aspergillus campestris IBT 28561]PKY03267.1 putative polyketide synthase [Aspergillus campestris IBT 28561]